MKKVLVIGSCGAGKSVFSRRLREMTGLPVIHLDRHFWRPGWTEPTKDVWRAQVKELLEGTEWIIDGNYGGTMDLRLESCDTVVFLDFPRLLSTWRVVKRAIYYRGRNRPDIADGCSEKIDLAFVSWTWNYPNRSRPQVIDRLERVRHRVDVITLCKAKEVEEFLRNVDSEHGK